MDDGDVEGVWKVFLEMESGHVVGGNENGGKWMCLYNCGAQAGASQGHKHMQLLPREVDGEGRVFETFADVAAEEGRLSFGK